jgi:hypothetical protein
MVRSLIVLAAVIAGGLAGCSYSSSPAKLTRQELEAKIAASRGWKSVSLKPTGDGSYAGTASKNDGTALQLKVNYKDGTLKVEWQSPDGAERGSTSESFGWSVKIE